jgi:queuine tRNA-ribosyltransferase
MGLDNMNQFFYTKTYQAKESRARLGSITTPHGNIETPAFVPVGTQASVKSLSPEEIDKVGTQLFFVNTYHMYLRPGIDIIKQFGGLHSFMHWNKPLITDSGGFRFFC